MSVTRRCPGPGLLLLLLSLGAGVEFSEPALAAGGTASSLPDGLVRVQFKRKLPGVFQGGKMIPQATILEVSEFTGVVIDAREGYVAAYIGSSWVDLGNVTPEVTIRFSEGNAEPAQLIGVDERVSLAVIRAPAAERRPAVLGRIAVRESIHLAFWTSPSGNGAADPFAWDIVSGQAKQAGSGGRWELAAGEVMGSMPTGFDSATLVKIRVEESEPFPRPHEWGGAVVLDGAGRVLGFVTRVESSGLSRSIRALTLLPVVAARNSLKEVVDRNESIRAGWLGIWMSDQADQVRVEKVVPGEPAERAGVAEGDVIVRFNETAIWSRDQFSRLLRSLTPGTKVDLTVERLGRSRKLNAVLGDWPESERPRFAWAIQVPDVWTSSNGTVASSTDLRLYKVPIDPPENLGLVVDSLTPQLAQYFKVPSGRGLLVKSVAEGSPAGRFGFLAGDVLARMNGRELEAATDMSKAIEASTDGVLVIEFYRNGVRMTRKVALH